MSKKDTNNYIQFQNAHSFKSSIGLIKEIERAVLFESGVQWVMDEDIEEYPKITLNVIKQIGKARKSNIMQNEYSYLVNSTNFDSIRKIQDFLKYLAETADLKSKDLRALNDDYTKGMAIGYFYWDAEKRYFLREHSGEMRFEIIDIRDFCVANPYIQDIQDQEWVMFNSQEKLGSIRKRFNLSKGAIEPDDYSYTSGTEKSRIADDEVYNNLDDHLVNVYTKFYRNDEGEVLFDIATKSKVLKKAQPLNPYYTSHSSKEQPNTTSLPDEKTKFKENDVRINTFGTYIHLLCYALIREIIVSMVNQS